VIALISSIPEEGKHLITQLRKNSAIGGKALFRGQLWGREIAYITSGIGKTNAAHATTLLLERLSPDLVILFGIGGAYPAGGLSIGDMAVAEKEIYGDEGVLVREGFRGAEDIGIPLLRKGRKKFFNEFPLDRRFLKKAVKCSARVAHVRSGPFVTVSTCTGTRERALELKERFGAVCENMEGASVAQICMLYGISMVEMRGISNIVEDRDKSKWNIRLAAENCQGAVQELLKGL